MIRWLRDIFLVLIGRGVVVPRDTVRLVAQIEVLASVLARAEPFRTEQTSIEPMNTANSLARLRFAVAYLATLPALFAKTKAALDEALAQQMPADTKRRLEELQTKVDEQEAALKEFDALADEAAAATDAADEADSGLPGADPDEAPPQPPEGEGNPPEGTGTGDGNPVEGGTDGSGSGTSVELEPPQPPVVDGTETPPGGDPLPPEDLAPPAEGNPPVPPAE